MKLLVLGGTRFLGRHVVACALSRGHDVSIFHRGLCNPNLFDVVQSLRGDRNTDLSSLRGLRFAAAIDTSGYTPAQLRATADVLRDAVEHYLFVSSISVYREFPLGQHAGEGAPLLEGHEGYGALKARAEEAIEEALPGRVARIRPGLIVGPHDPTDRFTYWPRRVAQGGSVLAPGRSSRQVQFIDARDLASWIVQLSEHRSTGSFNAVGPATTVTMEQLLNVCRQRSGSDARFTWVDDAGLLAAGVEPWTEMPLWIPESDQDFGGMLSTDNRRAIAAGLTFRPLEETVTDTLAWDRETRHTAQAPGRVQPITEQREAAILAGRPA
jgi:2'-hydroxyisoflavone reductase